MCVLGNVCIFRDLPYVVLQTYRVNSDGALRLTPLFSNLPTDICYLASRPLSQLRSYLPAGSLKEVSMSVGWCSLGGGSTLGQTFARLTHTLPSNSRMTRQVSQKYTLLFKIDSFFGNHSILTGIGEFSSNNVKTSVLAFN